MLSFVRFIGCLSRRQSHAAFISADCKAEKSPVFSLAAMSKRRAFSDFYRKSLRAGGLSFLKTRTRLFRRQFLTAQNNALFVLRFLCRTEIRLVTLPFTPYEAFYFLREPKRSVVFCGLFAAKTFRAFLFGAPAARRFVRLSYFLKSTIVSMNRSLNSISLLSFSTPIFSMISPTKSQQTPFSSL